MVKSYLSHAPAAIPLARSVLTNRATFAQVRFRAAPIPSVYNEFYVKSSSRYSRVHILLTPSSKSVARPRQLLRIEPCKQRPYNTAATQASTLPAKTQGFAPESLFKPELTRSRSVARYTSQLLDDGWLT